MVGTAATAVARTNTVSSVLLFLDGMVIVNKRFELYHHSSHLVPSYPGTYCEICACLDPDEQLDPDHVNCVEGCDSLTFYADGFCDDENNVCGCDWDGGDWCVWTNVHAVDPLPCAAK